MVALYAWEAGMTSRPTDDVDVLVDVRLAANGTEEVSRFLRERDYALEVTDARLAHLFRRGVAQSMSSHRMASASEQTCGGSRVGRFHAEDREQAALVYRRLIA
jgi:hypothetical protein